MSNPLKPFLIAALLGVCLSGCGTTQDHRIRVYRKDFQTLEPAEKEMIRNGRIERGFTSRMVYMALGNPGESSRTGGRMTWLYAGLIRDDGETGARFQTTGDLIWGSPFRRRAYDRLKVVFLDDKVVEIETEAREP